MIAECRTKPRGPDPVLGYLRETTEADQATASRVVEAFELQADDWIDGSPSWRGWGLHQAFLLGVIYARRKATAAVTAYWIVHLLLTENETSSEKENENGRYEREIKD